MENHLELDRTLRDLYMEDNEDGKIPDLAILIPSGTTSLSAGVPGSVKYAYQAPRAPSLGVDVMARVCMTTGPSYMSFVAGDMKLNFFNPDKHKNEPNGNAEYRVHQLDTLSNFDQLPEHQRPEIDFVYSPDEIVCADDQKVAFLTPLDCFSDVPNLIDPDVHYELLSKRELAVAGLPTPRSDLIDCDLTLGDIDSDIKVEEEVDRMINYVAEAVPPFVAKLPQALAGQGVYVVQNAEEQQDTTQKLIPEVRKMIKAINSENYHLHTACLIIQDMLPGTAVALSFFITKKGRAIFTGCCEQDIDSKGAWAGALINYSQQKELEAKYEETMQKIANHVFSRGYWGPMGADVMTDMNGEQLVIDLNVRIAGSYILGFLQNHLSVKRNFNYAALLYPLPLKGTRADFDKMFKQEIEDGKLLVVGWCHGRVGPWGIIKYSIASVVAAAESPEDLRSLSDRVNARRIRK